VASDFQHFRHASRGEAEIELSRLFHFHRTVFLRCFLATFFHLSASLGKIRSVLAIKRSFFDCNLHFASALLDTVAFFVWDLWSERVSD
jgi:hypothetical protein